jgi:hypothetical protein
MKPYVRAWRQAAAPQGRYWFAVRRNRAHLHEVGEDGQACRTHVCHERGAAHVQHHVQIAHHAAADTRGGGRRLQPRALGALLYGRVQRTQSPALIFLQFLPRPTLEPPHGGAPSSVLSVSGVASADHRLAHHALSGCIVGAPLVVVLALVRLQRRTLQLRIPVLVHIHRILADFCHRVVVVSLSSAPAFPAPPVPPSVRVAEPFVIEWRMFIRHSRSRLIRRWSTGLRLNPPNQPNE